MRAILLAGTIGLIGLASPSLACEVVITAGPIQPLPPSWTVAGGRVSSVELVGEEHIQEATRSQWAISVTLDRIISGMPSVNGLTIAYTLFTGGDMCEPYQPPVLGDRIALSLIFQNGEWTAVDVADEDLADEVAAEMRLSDQD